MYICVLFAFPPRNWIAESLVLGQNVNFVPNLDNASRKGGAWMEKSLVEYCARLKDKTLLQEWHTLKNGELSPVDVSPGSKRLAWWQCEKGHEWQAQVKSRVHGSGCPVCANRTLAQGVNDLATTHPELALQWHPTKNGALTPQDVMAGTRRKVWWQCEHGHAWEATVGSRADGRGCPVCAGRQIIPGVNDFASQYPELAREWHETKNGALTPEHVAVQSNRKAWWRCQLGHEYEAPISMRVARGSGCPYCAGRRVLPGFNDLESQQPGIAAQWYTVLNGELQPSMVTVGARKKVWWQCEEGHVWKAMIYSRAGPKKCGCPICAGVAKAPARRRIVARDRGQIAAH